MRRLLLLMILCTLAPAAGAAAAPPVTNTADNGPGSLRAALAGAASGETINVPPGTYSLNSGPLVAGTSVHLVGTAGPGSTTITTSAAQRLLVSLSPLTVSGITFSGGSYATSSNNDGGAAIFDNSADVTISNSAFVNNATSTTAAVGFFGGGAVYVNGNLTISGSTFSGNSASATNGTDDGGGAIFVSGGGSTLTLSNDSFSGDNFTETSASNNAGGGAIFAANVPVVMSGGSIAGAHATVTGASGAQDDGGGAIWSGAGVTLAGVSLTGNIATVNAAAVDNGGGAIFNSGGPVAITASTLAGNTAALALHGLVSNGGGGLYVLDGALALSNSTVSGNTVSASGPGANKAAGGALYFNGTGSGTISSTTIAGNTVQYGAPTGRAVGGGVYGFSTGTLTFLDTILAGNTSSGGAQCDNDGAPFASAGHNIDDGTSCGFVAGGDQQNTNPQLGALAANGGATRTQALLGGSPAIDHGAGCPAADQRGVARPVGSACDVGAYEFAPPLSTATAAACAGSATVGLSVPAGTSAASVMSRIDGGPAQSAPGAAATISVSPGLHSVEFWGVDSGGDAEQVHHTISVLADTAAPTVTVASEQNTSNYSLGQAASVVISASGAASGFASNPSRAHVAIPTNVLGTHTVSSVARSNCGLQGSGSFAYTVHAAGSPVAAPSLFDRTFGIPSSKKCFSGRAFIVHVHAPKGTRIKRVKITLAGRSRTLSGSKHLVVLRGLPRGAFTLKLDATTTTGKHIKGSRRYHTCKKKKKK